VAAELQIFCQGPRRGILLRAHDTVVNPKRINEISSSANRLPWLCDVCVVFDEQMVLDHETWIMNLTESNKRDNVTWFKEYSARVRFVNPFVFTRCLLAFFLEKSV